MNIIYSSVTAQVICIEAPFAGKALEAEVVANVETLQQCTTFLFDENTAWARSELGMTQFFGQEQHDIVYLASMFFKGKNIHIIYLNKYLKNNTLSDKVLQHCVVSHKSAGMCLKQLITNTKTTYQKCMDLVQKSFHWPRKVELGQ